MQTRLLYAGANRMTAMRLATLDLPEGNAMRAPGEAPGLMALEIAMDEMAEKLGIDPVAVPDHQRYPGRSGKAASGHSLTAISSAVSSSARSVSAGADEEGPVPGVRATG